MSGAPTRLPLALGAALVTGLLGLVLWCGGPRGLIYVGLYALTLLPGLPIGWRLFGRDQPAGWVGGAFIGYGLTALAFWAAIRIGSPHPLFFALMWLAVTVLVWLLVSRDMPPLVPLPPFTWRGAAAGLLVLLLVFALLTLPFARLGAADASGRRYYRAYFTADFIWHTALTQELARFDTPPRNPFFAHDALHYYYTYFLVPAVLSGPERAPLVPVETALKITAINTALLMASLLFAAIWSVAGRAWPAAAASLLAFVAPSFEGLYKIWDLWRHRLPLSRLADINIDAVTAWDFHGLRIDGLVRSMWYTPQHTTSFSLGLVAVIVAMWLPERPRRLTYLTTGLALGLSVSMNPLLGAAFCATYGVTVAFDVATRRLAPAVLPEQVLTVVPVALALGWCVANRMGEGAGSHLSFGWLYDARNAPVLTLILSLGGLLIPAAVGCWTWPTIRLRRVVPAAGGVVVGLALLYLVTLTDRSWVGFRAGNILQVTLPLLAARALTGLLDAGYRRIAIVGVVALLMAGAPTTVIDTYNAQDIGNLHMGPGFPWTISLSPAQQAGLAWIRHFTPQRTIVQADPETRFRSNWSIIPTFAGRRMAAGQALPLLPEPHQAGAAARVHALLTALPLDTAHDEARRLGIDYFWIDEDDVAGRLGGDPARFLPRPDLFALAFRQDQVAIYRVQ
jgi:hypothetical protein